MEEHHAGHYKVFNFCCEPGRGYDPEEMGGNVERYPFRDHGVPPLDTMAAFCNSAKAWLDADSSNVVALHCKAGKGRAGIMTCCLLLRMGLYPTAIDAMNYYDVARTVNGNGLTVTSQRKFVCLYERLWREVWGVSGQQNIGKWRAEEYDGEKYELPESSARSLVKVEILQLPHIFEKETNFLVKVVAGTTSSKFDFTQLFATTDVTQDQESQIWSANGVNATIKDNFSVQLFCTKKGLFKNKKIKICELWHNTIMIDDKAESITFGLSELNIKKKYRKKIQDNDALTLRLTFGGGATMLVDGAGQIKRKKTG
jgi:hypothetical protein